MTQRKPGGFLKRSADRRYLAAPSQLSPWFLPHPLLPGRQVGSVAAPLSRGRAAGEGMPAPELGLNWPITARHHPVHPEARRRIQGQLRSSATD